MAKRIARPLRLLKEEWDFLDKIADRFGLSANTVINLMSQKIRHNEKKYGEQSTIFDFLEEANGKTLHKNKK